jgi:hypothetical protein
VTPRYLATRTPRHGALAALGNPPNQAPIRADTSVTHWSLCTSNQCRLSRFRSAPKANLLPPPSDGKAIDADPSPALPSPLIKHLKIGLYLGSNLICTKARTLCVPGLEFIDVPGFERFKKTLRNYYVLVFFGGTPKNGETTGQRYICQQEVNPSSSK